MKKQFKKKLVFNKHTVTNLTPGEMSNAFAGDALTIFRKTYCVEDCSLVPCTNNTTVEAAAREEEDNYLQ